MYDYATNMSGLVGGGVISVARYPEGMRQAGTRQGRVMMAESKNPKELRRWNAYTCTQGQLGVME